MPLVALTLSAHINSAVDILTGTCFVTAAEPFSAGQILQKSVIDSREKASQP